MCQRLKTSKPNQVTPGLDKHPSGTVTGGAPRIRLALMKRMTPVEQANQALQQVKDAGSGKTALELGWIEQVRITCLLYTSPSPRDRTRSRMPSSA